MLRAYKYHPSVSGYRHASHGRGASSEFFSATYDQDYNPTNRTVSGGIYNHTYDTDDAGNIIQIGTPTFGYDALNRLNAETPGSISYTYDATSNRLTKVSGGTTTSTVPSTSNKVSAVGGNAIVYNSAGAFTSYGSTAYNWNATGQISFISTSGSTVGTYTYNASNQRTKKVAGGNTVHYVYGLGGLLYGEYDGSGALIREYVYQNDAPLAQIDAGSPEVLTYLHTDHLGTPKYGTNAVGTSVWAANTDPFGVGTPSGSRTVNLRMAGQYYDSESGLFYNWNRYYHPALGRYISSDPIGLAGGPNTFNYASVSPVMFTDPEGLQALVPTSPTILAARPTPWWAKLPEEAQNMPKVRNSKTGKEAADDVPGWCKQCGAPKVKESGRDWANRISDDRYGPGNYPKGPGTEHNQIQKYGDRAFEVPKSLKDSVNPKKAVNIISPDDVF